MSAIDTTFLALFSWAAIGFVLLAIGGLLCWRCTRPIERLRCIQMTLIALAATFVLQFIPAVPHWNLAWLAADRPVADHQWVADTMNDHSPRTVNQLATFDRPANAIDRQHQNTNSRSESPDVRPKAINDSPTRFAAASEESSRVDVHSSQTSATQSAWTSWMRGSLIAAFLAGAVAGIVSFAWGVWRLHRLSKASRPAAPEIERIFATIAPGRRRHVEIRISPDIAVPITFGLFRPVILLPAQLAASETESTLRYCLAHEWRHICHHDVAQWWATQCLEPLVWFQPFYWLLAREMRICQDQLADCFATEATNDPLAYADLLVQFAKQRCDPFISAALTMADGRSKLMRRVNSLLDGNHRLGQVCRWPVIFPCLLLLAGLGILLGSINIGRSQAQSTPATRAATTSVVQNGDADPSSQNDLSQSARFSRQAAQYSAKPGLDIDGDPLPAGAIARLGTKSFRPGQENEGRDIDRLTFLPDSQTIIRMTNQGGLQYWDSSTGKLQKQTLIADHNIQASACTPDGHWVVVGSYRTDEARREYVSSFELIDTQSKNDPLKWEVVDDPFDGLAISPDGRTVAWGRSKISLFDVASQTELPGREIEGGEVGALRFSPDGKMLAIGGPGKVLLWNWAGKEEPRSVIVPGYPRFGPQTVRIVSFSPDGKLIAAGTNRIVLADTETGKVVPSVTVPGAESWGLDSLAFSPDGKQLAVNAAGGATLWEVANGNLARRLRHPAGSASNLVFSPDGRRLAGNTFYLGATCVWNLETGEPIGADRPGHFLPANTLRFFNHDQQLASAGDDGTIRIWNLANSSQARAMHPSGWIRAMDVSPDGKYVVSSSLDDTVRLWENTTGREIYRLPGHGRMGGTRAVHFSRDGKQFVSWGDDMRIVRWDVATGKALQEFETGSNVGVHNSPGENPFEPLAAGPRIDSATFSTDLKTLLLVGSGPQTAIRRFSAESGRELPQINRPSRFTTRAVLLPDNQHLLIAGWNPTRGINLPGGIVKLLPPTTYPVEVFNLSDERIVANREFIGHGADRVAYSPDGRLAAIAVVGDPPKIDLCTIPNLADAGQIELPSCAGAVEFSASGKLLAASVADGTILVWDLQRLPPILTH